MPLNRGVQNHCCVSDTSLAKGSILTSDESIFSIVERILSAYEASLRSDESILPSDLASVLPSVEPIFPSLEIIPFSDEVIPLFDHLSFSFDEVILSFRRDRSVCGQRKIQVFRNPAAGLLESLNVQSNPILRTVQIVIIQIDVQKIDVPGNLNIFPDVRFDNFAGDR